MTGICKFKEASFSYNAKLIGLPLVDDISNKEMSIITRSLNENLTHPKKDLHSVVYRGGTSISPILTLLPDSCHHLVLFDKKCPIYVSHPLSCSLNKNIAKEFGKFLHVIHIVDPKTSIVDTLSERVKKKCKDYWKKREDSNAYMKNLEREEEIIILPNQWLVPMKKNETIFHWKLLTNVA